MPDDFDVWWPRRVWHEADVLVWVSDARFESDSGPPSYAGLLGSYAPLHTRQVWTERGGRAIRLFIITVLSRRMGV